MGQFYETFPASLVQWLLEQKVFYIASAPLSGDGHVNVSPKGISDKGGPFFGVVKESKSGSPLNSKSEDGSADSEKANDKNVVIRKFWYMDLTGSGIETTSHLHEPGNGRITVMFNAFSGPPRILRLWGKGKWGLYFSFAVKYTASSGRRIRVTLCLTGTFQAPFSST